MKNLFRAVFMALVIPCLSFGYYPTDFETDVSLIAFGSCNREHLPQPLWKVIRKINPDLWIWMGDNVYGDTRDMAVMKGKYSKQFNLKEYKAFRESIPIIGTWDDHDFGENDSGGWYPMKKESQQLALDFYEEPEGTARRKQAGIYTAYEFGSNERKVKVILLDTRYHAERPGKDADILGENQWKWLEEELLGSTAKLKIIGTSIQFLSMDHKSEKWANYPKARKRLMSFIRKNKISGILFISGDRHFNDISIKNDSETHQALIDVTSSGMNVKGRREVTQENRFRHGKGYHGKCFALIKIDWEKSKPEVRVEIRDEDNQLHNEVGFSLE